MDANKRPRRSLFARIILGLLALVLFAGFIALGTWQVERRAWKLDLIARVDARVHADPVAAPDRSDWPNVTTKRDEYRHVQVHGTYRNEKESYVYASTDYGAGYWVITPLVRDDGTVVMINRGFVPTDHKKPDTREDGQIGTPVTVTGLLRIDEPGGTFLRDNAPQDDRWYSRDVKAMATKRGLDTANVAPYFIDADGSAHTSKLPIGGLTKVHFRNSHLSYAITWYGMALLVVAWWGFLFYRRRSKDD